MLYGLAQKGMASPRLGRLSDNGVPVGGLVLSVVVILSALLLLVSDSIIDAFTIVTTISSVLFIFIWGLILASYMVYLRRHPDAHAASIYRMPGARFMPQVVLAFFAAVLVMLTQEKDTLQALVLTPIWFIALGVIWYFKRLRVSADVSQTKAMDTPSRPSKDRH